LEDLDLGWRLLLKRIIRNRIGTWSGFIWLRIGKVVGRCESCNAPSGSIKYVEFLTTRGTANFCKMTYFYGGRCMVSQLVSCIMIDKKISFYYFFVAVSNDSYRYITAMAYT
jgi:hypothetical protein